MTLEPGCSILEMLPVPAAVLSDRQQILYANIAFCRMFGEFQDRIGNVAMSSLLKLEDDSIFSKATGERWVRSWGTIAGQKRCLEMSGAPYRDVAGELSGWLWLFKDITDQETVLEKVHKIILELTAWTIDDMTKVSTDGPLKPLVDDFNLLTKYVIRWVTWYEHMFDSIPFQISMVGNDMKWQFINKSVEQKIGLGRYDVIGWEGGQEGKPCNTLHTPICGTENCALTRLHNGQSRTFFKQDGRHYQVDASFTRDVYGKDNGVIEIFQDITKLVKSEQYQKVEVERLANNLRLLAKGNLDIDLKQASGDEYTKLEHENFQRVYASLNEVSGAISQLNTDTDMLIQTALAGSLSTRATVERHDGVYRQIIEGINNILDTILAPINEAAFCLQEMAKGRLDVEIKGDYKGDYAVIKENLNSALGSLNDILNQAAQAAGQMAIGARQVSDSSQALSQAATESANSLEEISASMNELTSQTNINADNTTQANKLAVQARLSAEKGDEEMNDMARAMKEINEAAANISKIIKAIDEIAFQTNLLALNAAVEAARAGKHGKGFTVVAEEVRNLAQKSANAAKETAQMIEESIKKTEIGTKIAKETSRALAEIVAESTKVTDLVSEITAASKEQAQGINQINSGLTQVDLVTQQVTSNAGDSAAASEELSNQAQQLKAMLSKFTLRKEVTCKVVSGLRADEITPEMIQAAARDAQVKELSQPFCMVLLMSRTCCSGMNRTQ